MSKPLLIHFLEIVPNGPLAEIKPEILQLFRNPGGSKRSSGRLQGIENRYAYFSL
jgi:hypothetical protein